MMMSTFSGFTVPGGHKEDKSMVNEEVVNLNYPEVVTDHYRYRGSVENHNFLIHNGSNKC